MKKRKKGIYKVVPIVMLSSLLAISIASPLALHANEDVVESDEMNQTRAVDITKPVIEKVEFPANGTTVNAGEELPINVDAYDADSGIKEIVVSYDLKGPNDLIYYTSVTLTKSAEGNRYEGKIIVKDGGFTSGKITQIKATDNNANYATYDIGDYENYTYQFLIQNSVAGKVATADKITFSKNQQALSKGDALEMSIKLSENDVDRFNDIYVVFKNENENGNRTYEYSMYKNDGNEFESQAILSDNMLSGKWTLNRIYGYENDTETKIIYNESDIWFQLVGEDDTTPPVIESFEMTPNGTTLKVGDVVDF